MSDGEFYRPDLAVSAALARQANAPVPRPGQSKDFDRHVRDQLKGASEDVDEKEIRKALWATWKTKPPEVRPTTSRREAEDDDELARAIALSVEDSGVGTTSRDPIVFDVDDDEDDELQRAIAASEAESKAGKGKKRSETPEEERRALAEAMAASLAPTQPAVNLADGDKDDDAVPESSADAAYRARREAERAEEARLRAERKGTTTLSGASPNVSHPPSPVPMTALNVNTSSSAGLSSLFGDRAQMERDRLARQAARATPSAGPVSSTDAPTAAVANPVAPASFSDGRTKTPPVMAKEAAAQPKKSYVQISPNTVNKRNGIHSLGAGGSRSISPAVSRHPFRAANPPRDTAGEYFLDGEMRHSALTIGEASDAPVFSPKQVIGNTSQISLMIMSSFVLDDEWLSGIMPDPALTPTIICRPHPKEMHPQWNGKVQAQPNGQVWCYPEMVGEFGSAHMKYMWIFYKTGRLRLVVMSCNMVPYDWEWIENTIFVQDLLPVASNSTASQASQSSDFANGFRTLFVKLKAHKALRHLIEAHPMGPQIDFSPANAFEAVWKWDWSRVKVKLVMSVPGTYAGVENMEEYGLCRLGKVLNDEGWQPQKGEVVHCEYQGSSLGTYSHDWFDLFHQLCCGKTIRPLLQRPKPMSWPPVKVMFPSLATVQSSILGTEGGGTMFCGKAFNSVTKKLFYDSNSKRGGVLMHAKMIIATFEPRPRLVGLEENTSGQNGKRKADTLDEGDGGVGGWVYMGSHNFSSAAWGTVNAKKDRATMTIRNYELGILFPIPRKDSQAIADEIAPYRRPARPYSASDVPWDQKAHGISERPGAH